ncbi:MAG: TIR domain-containing protein [Candidatus Omnitrophica bacterium]|nr:TIR domain-containing protein [Candidatus Omnitrophota bacterium]
MGHKCFISFKTEDMAYKEAIQKMEAVDMIDKSLNEAINSDNEEYIMQKIRSDYLSDSTVTIHLIGLQSAENLGYNEQRFIKRELQASLYNGENNPRSGILGVVLPHVVNNIYGGQINCSICGGVHNYVKIGHDTVVKEFSHNYYIPHNKCAHSEDDRYCILVPWDTFVNDPNKYIDEAFSKRDHQISNKIKVRP